MASLVGRVAAGAEQRGVDAGGEKEEMYVRKIIGIDDISSLSY